MFDPRAHDEVVALFYAAATGEGSWNAALARSANLFRSSVSLFGVHDASMSVLAMESHSYSREFMASYFSGPVYAGDPRLPHIARCATGSVYYDEMLYDVRKMERDDRVREATRQMGVHDQIGMKLSLPNGGTATLNMLRTTREGRVTRSSVTSFRRLLPHIQQACSLAHILELNAGTTAALLDALALRSDGLILLNWAGAPTFVNDAAADILRVGDGLAYTSGEFVTARMPETRALRRMIGEAVSASLYGTGRPGGRLLVSRRRRGQPLVLNVLPASHGKRFLTAPAMACVVHIQDMAFEPAASVESLRMVFGLTEREAHLASEFAREGQLDSAAAKARMSVNTARNHLRSIYAKTGASGQVPLMKLLSRLG